MLRYSYEIPWEVMGKNLIQEEMIRMEEFVDEF